MILVIKYTCNSPYFLYFIFTACKKLEGQLVDVIKLIEAMAGKTSIHYSNPADEREIKIIN